MIFATILGNLTRDVETVQIGQNEYFKFTVATSTWKKDQSGNHISAFVDCLKRVGNTNSLGQYLVKGTKVQVMGELTTNTYQGKDGNTYSSINLSVASLEFAGRANSNADNNTTENNAGTQSAAPFPPTQPTNPNDLPF